MRAFLLPVLLLFAAAPSARASDVLCLKDGRIVEAPKMTRSPEGITVFYTAGKVFCPEALVMDAVLADEVAAPPANDEDKERLAKGLVKFENKWMPLRQRDQLLAKRLDARRKDVEEMKAHLEWRNRGTEDTKHFHFEYTVPQHIFEGYRDTMEAYFTDFARAWKIKAPTKEDRLTVSFHADKESYCQVSGANPNVLGWFRYIRPWDLNIYYERLDPAYSTAVMFHESNHYLQKLLDLKFAMPHFPGESLAEYYGASVWDPATKKITTGLLQEGRICQIQADVDGGETMALDKLISTEGMFEHYTWGWALVHFLMSDARYADRFQKFIYTLVQGKDVKRIPLGRDNLSTVEADEVLRVFMLELGLKDGTALRKLEAEWHDYIETKLKVVTPNGLARAATEAMSEGRPLRAQRLFKEAIEKGNKNPITFHRYANLLLAKGKHKEAIENWKKAIEIDPFNGRFYAFLGHALEMKDKKNTEAAGYIALAKELGYDEPWREIKLSADEDD